MIAPAHSAVEEDETFQGLALHYRGPIGLRQEEVTRRLGARVRSIQLWESGTSYSSAASLSRLISPYLEGGGF